MFNFLGVSCNFSVLAGTRWQSVFRFVDAETGAAAGLDGVTFSGQVHCDGQEYSVELTLSEADAARNEVFVSFPPLPEGRWVYEIWVTAETGEKMRLLEGRVSALGLLVPDAQGVYSHRTLDVLLPGEVNKRIQLEWQASTLAVQAMQESMLHAAAARKSADEAAEDADRVSGARDVANRIESALHSSARLLKESRFYAAALRMEAVDALPDVGEADEKVVYFVGQQAWLLVQGVWQEVACVYSPARPGGGMGLFKVGAETADVPGVVHAEVAWDAAADAYVVVLGRDFVVGSDGIPMLVRARAGVAGVVECVGTEDEDLGQSDGMVVPSLALVEMMMESSQESNRDYFRESLTSKMDNDMSNVAENVDYVVSHEKVDAGWVRVWRSGWCEQGGQVRGMETANPFVTLPRAMANSDYLVHITTQSNVLQGAHYGAEMTQGRSNERFQVRCESGGAFSWRVEGYTV